MNRRLKARRKKTPMSNEDGTMRLNQFLARTGAASRRHAEELIKEGRVVVNGERVKTFAIQIDPHRDTVLVDGEKVRIPSRLSYYIFYKPKEVVSTMDDPEGRECITKFFPKGVKGLFPVGRLDYHSEGLLLLTNDGELSARLLHPRYKVQKTYNLKVKGDPEKEMLDRLRRGILLEGRKTMPVDIRRIPSRETRHTWVEIKMMEGRKNQLREMFFRIEHPVIKLKRVAIGSIRIGKMKSGEVRQLTVEEISELRKEAGL
jgi:23S rRNA pseudouridine2605 synthase